MGDGLVSGVSPTVQSMHLPHPWRRLAEALDVTLRWHDDGPMGRCRHSTREVSLRRGMTQAERRATLLHELEHLNEGPAVRGFERDDEMQTRERAARWLIPLKDLADALVWANDDLEVADVLWVDIHTVQTRLTTLTVEETAELNRRLDAAEITFPKS